MFFGVTLEAFWVPNLDPGGSIFGVFFKNVIFSKLCSRCGGSTILKARTLQTSVRKATSNDNGAKVDKKLLKTSLCDAPWAENVNFTSILGTGQDPTWSKMGSNILPKLCQSGAKGVLGTLF